VLDILFYGAGLLAGVGAAVLCIVEVRKGQVLPTIGSALVALMAFATLGLGVFRDHKSNQELVRINEQNLSLRDWIGPREVNKNALKASVGTLGVFAMEIVQLPNVFDGEPIAQAMFEALQEVGWNVALKSPQNSSIEELRATASSIKNPRGIILVFYPGFDQKPEFKSLMRALQAFAVDAHSSKEDGRLSVGQLRVLVAQKDR